MACHAANALLHALDAFIRLAAHDGQPTQEGRRVILPPGKTVLLAVPETQLGPFLQRSWIAAQQEERQRADRRGGCQADVIPQILSGGYRPGAACERLVKAPQGKVVDG